MTSDQIESIIDYFELSSEYFVWQMENANSTMDNDERLQLYYESVILPDNLYGDADYEKVLALMQHDDCDWADAKFKIDKEYYKVLDDAEAQKEFEKSVEYFVDDVMSEIPEHLRQYFDEKSYIEDNLNDRGSQLNHYDGCEYEEEVNGTTYYIYKQ